MRSVLERTDREREVTDISRTDDVKKSIEKWAEPNEELGWPGSEEVKQHAEEIAAYLWEQELISPGEPPAMQIIRAHGYGDTLDESSWIVRQTIVDKFSGEFFLNASVVFAGPKEGKKDA